MAWVDAWESWQVCRGQRTICGSQFSPSAMQVPRIKLRLSCLLGRQPRLPSCPTNHKKVQAYIGLLPSQED